MTIWIPVAVGAYIALLFAAEIYFGKLNKRQVIYGSEKVLTMLSIIMLFWCGPWLGRKAEAHGISIWWIVVGLIIAPLLVTQVVRYLKRGL